MRAEALRRTALIVAAGCWLAAAPRLSTRAAPTPQRIVSVVPALTEMLFAIGTGSRVVAVSSFDEQPPEVKRLPRVGALLDPDLERILTLKPDLVIVYESQTDLRQQLDRASIPTFVYKHAGLREITQTMRALGERTGASRAADLAASDIERRLDDVRRRVAPRPHPRTLLVFGRDRMTLRNIYASGGYGFLHDLLELAGGTNVYADVAQQSVQASTEHILRLAPEAIIELKYTGELDASAIARERSVWNALSAVPAVRSGRIHLLVGDEFVVPGPRIPIAAERLARALHPEAFPDRVR